MFQFLPFHFLLAFVTGICAGFFLEVSPQPLLAATGVLFSLLWAMHHRSGRSFSPQYSFALLALIAFLLLGASRAAMRKPQFQADHFQHGYAEGMALQVRVLASSKAFKGVYRYEAEVIRAGGKSTRGRVLIRLDTSGIKRVPEFGDVLLCRAPVREISAKRNPGGFDFRAYAFKKGIYHMIWGSGDQFQVLERETKGPRALADALRQLLIRSLGEQGFGKDELAVIQALLLGQRHDLSESLLESYRMAGAVHILAVSGLHLGILVLIFRFLLHPLLFLPRGRALRIVCLVLLIWAYALLTGMSASVVRAAAMFTALSIGLYTNRPSSAMRAMVISFLLLLLANPLYLFDVGFQLSYTAVFGILWFGPLLYRLWRPKRKFLNYFWKLITVSCSAQLGILPLSLFYFHGFSPLFVLSSLAILPFLGFILGIGILVLILAAMRALPFWMVQVYDAMIHGMNALIQGFSALETLVVAGMYFSLTLVLLLYGLLLSLGFWWQDRTPKALRIVCVSVLCFQSVLLYDKVTAETSREFVVFHLSRDTMAVIRSGRRVQVYFARDSVRARPIVEGYAMQNPGTTLEWYGDTSLLRIHGKRILFLEDTAMASLDDFTPEILVLRNSPDINLDRYLQTHRPEVLVADGSNYASYVRLWQGSCKKARIRFHSTYEDGAYIFPEAP